MSMLRRAPDGRPSPGRARPGRARTLRALLTGAASLAIVANMMAAPAAAGVPAASKVGVQHTQLRELGRPTSRPVHVDARAAARASANATRESRPLVRHKVEIRNQQTVVNGRSASTLAGGAASIGAVRPQVVAQPAPVVISNVDATNSTEACGGCEPPDPWIAVSSTHVVTTTNGMVRVTNRVGSLLMQEPTWALFAVPVDRFDSDPRIIWDSFHSRWIGVVSTFTGDFSSNGLRLAVSETADPTAGWIVYPIEYGGDLPDFPGISSSPTRVVLSSDDYTGGAAWAGPSILIMNWSNIIAGTSLAIDGGQFTGAPFGHFRPAVMLSSTSNTPVIYESFIDGDARYFEISGGVGTLDFPVDVSLGSAFGSVPFTLPPDPVQPGAVTISTAADERPTDAVYRSGQLWFVATGDFNDGVDDWAMARYTQVSTAANGTGPTAAVDVPGSGPGVHYFTPGVGINADGSVFVTATKTDPTSIYPTTVMGAVLAGSGIYPYVDISASEEAYTGNRWGDFVGVAADPAAAGSVWVQHELVETGGSWRTEVLRVASDGVAPASPTVMSQVLVTASTVGLTVPVKTSWSGASDADSGVAKYLVERADDGGGYFGVQTTGSSITQPLLVGHRYQYRVTAIDAVGNVGTPTYGPSYIPTLYQSNLSNTVYTTGWGSSTSASYSGGSTKYSSTAGKYATFTATNARSIAIVATKATTRGSFKVYVDGVYKATVSTYSTTTRYRQTVYQFAWSAPGTHKIKVVISGTSGHPRVDLDAFVVLR